jgi:hypothetical protein
VTARVERCRHDVTGALSILALNEDRVAPFSSVSWSWPLGVATWFLIVDEQQQRSTDESDTQVRGEPDGARNTTDDEHWRWKQKRISWRGRRASPAALAGSALRATPGWVFRVIGALEAFAMPLRKID